jgi:large subunit ribosomal protein L4
VFAPKPRTYRQLVNKKVRRLAMKSALTAKVQSGEFIVLDALQLPQAKTREMVRVLKALNARSPMVVLAQTDETVRRASGNIPECSTTLVGALNVYDILRHGSVIVTRDAVEQIEEVYA